MRPIKLGLLPDTVTIYNAHRDQSTGKNAFYRTFLRYVRVMSNVTKSIASVDSGVTWASDTSLLLDHGLTITGQKYSTEAYTIGDDGRRAVKKYLDPAVWAASADKAQHWTLERDNYVISGECPVLIPPQAEQDLTVLNPWKVAVIAVSRQKDGTVHSWEVQLV